MKDHLPECQRWYANMPEPDECPACEMFRACEQRVHEAAWRAGHAEGFQRGLSWPRTRKP